MTRTQIEKLRLEIVRLFTEYNCLMDCTIYCNNTRWMYGCKFSEDYSEMTITEKIEENIDVSEYLEYCNPDTISIAFDGSPLYGILNYSKYAGGFIDKFSALLERYGLYYELGYAWNLSLYEI